MVTTTEPKGAPGMGGIGLRAPTSVVVGLTLLIAACTDPLERPFDASRSRVPTNVEEQPASTGPVDIFDQVHGWIAYGDPTTIRSSGTGTVPGIWAIDPSSDLPVARVQISPRGGEPIAWSADGSMLLIRRTGDEGGPWSGLFVMHADGVETRLTDGNPTMGSGGSFTPDGSRIVYSADSRVYIVDVTGGTPDLLFAARRGWLAAVGPDERPALSTPALSPDGTRIALIAGTYEDGHSLWSVRVDGSSPRLVLAGPPLGRSESWSSQLSWSPDGMRLAFDLYVPRFLEAGSNSYILVPSVYVVGADGSGLTRLARNASNPHWSPDGASIAFDSYDDPFERLTIAAPDGSSVTAFGSGQSGPWNPLTPPVAP